MSRASPGAPLRHCRVRGPHSRRAAKRCWGAHHPTPATPQRFALLGAARALLLPRWRLDQLHKVVDKVVRRVLEARRLEARRALVGRQ
eukprot:1220234-Prymnesium_polylepis.1